MSDVKLYRVKGCIDKMEWRGLTLNDVDVVWACYGRSESIGPYEELIKDYDPEKDNYAQTTVDEAFTEEEASALIEYLESKHGDHFEMDELNLPVPQDSCGPFMFHDAAGNHGDITADLWKDEGYDLPFQAIGIFYASDSPVIKATRTGVKFIQSFFDHVGLQLDNGGQLFEAVNRLIIDGWEVKEPEPEIGDENVTDDIPF